MNLLILCTGNSCRSQMAEGFARHFGKGRLAVTSAGIEAHGLNPRAVSAMKEIGIDISGHSSKLIDDSMIASADLILTVCDNARERCPVVPSVVRQRHWSFDDPAKATGAEAEIMAEFRRVRDEIGAKIKSLVSEL